MMFGSLVNKNKKFDWAPKFDERSKLYGVSEIIPEKTHENSKLWKEGPVLDQGHEGACVGFGWTAHAICDPNAPAATPWVGWLNDLARSFYKRAQKLDKWPGEDYSGTSVLAGAKVMKEKGLISEYRWCFSIDELRDAVVNIGPVVIGIPWYSGMYDVRHVMEKGKDSYALVEISGDLVGGHCITVTGYDFETKMFRWRNSWGKWYGIGGSAYIKEEDLNSLVANRAEMCIPIKTDAENISKILHENIDSM